MMKTISSLIIAMSFSISVLATAETIKNDMHQIAESFTQLGKQIDDSTKNASSIALLDTVIAKTKDAQNKVPSALEKKKGAEKEKLVADYKTQMGMMAVKLAAAKASLQNHDNASARKIFDELKPWTQPDHSKKYQ